MATVLINCTCRHQFQEQQYGPGIRVANILPPKAKDAPERYRCTVCKRESGVKASG